MTLSPKETLEAPPFSLNPLCSFLCSRVCRWTSSWCHWFLAPWAPSSGPAGAPRSVEPLRGVTHPGRLGGGGIERILPARLRRESWRGSHLRLQPATSTT
jgi:hypothetical protein